MNQTREKKQIILDIATRIFSRYGYAKTSLDEIAQDAKIAKGTIYYYFPSKEDLFLNVVKAQAQQFVQEMHGSLSKVHGFENKLRYFMQAPMIYVCEKMPLWVEGLKAIPFNFQQHFDGFREENRGNMLSLLMEIIHEGIEQGLVSDRISADRLCEVINDWFLMGYLSIVVVDFDELLLRIKRDHETIMQLIMYGIVKRG
ncbi:MAG TPA: TetR/AcrR family transcriptional regulator [Candidatus Cloacimonadota bacterium]|nr:TetR/AcrR family transcriptional regulator [Candidatus Cloacimonadota bacterium]